MGCVAGTPCGCPYNLPWHDHCINCINCINARRYETTNTTYTSDSDMLPATNPYLAQAGPPVALESTDSNSNGACSAIAQTDLVPAQRG